MTYTTAHGTGGSLTHWVGPRIKPASSGILVEFVTTEPQWERLIFKALSLKTLPAATPPPRQLSRWYKQTLCLMTRCTSSSKRHGGRGRRFMWSVLPPTGKVECLWWTFIYLPSFILSVINDEIPVSQVEICDTRGHRCQKQDESKNGTISHSLFNKNL